MDPISQAGIGGVAGFLLGYAFKKVLKLFLVLIGLYLGTLVYLEQQGYLELKYSRIVDSLISMNLPPLSFSLPLAGFGIGFGLGFRAG